jgi:hypothetical protein
LIDVPPNEANDDETDESAVFAAENEEEDDDGNVDDKVVDLLLRVPTSEADISDKVDLLFTTGIDDDDDE